MKLEQLESIARESRFRFKGVDEWSYDEEHPHISRFKYTFETNSGEGESKVLGEVNGYRITHELSSEGDESLWEEADAVDADAVTYVDSLIREFLACNKACDHQTEYFLSDFTRTLIIRDVTLNNKRAVEPDDTELFVRVVASLVVKEGPNVVLVDPYPYAKERKTSAGKMKGRRNSGALLELGLNRMVTSRFVWGLDYESESLVMDGYDYEQLSEAKRSGSLGEVLSTRLADDVFGVPLTDEMLQRLGIPIPEEDFDEDG